MPHHVMPHPTTPCHVTPLHTPPHPTRRHARDAAHHSTLHYHPIQIKWSNRSESTALKSEVVEYLKSEADNDALNELKPWQIRVAAIQYRNIITYHFMMDVQSEMSRVSLVFQRDNIAPRCGWCVCFVDPSQSSPLQVIRQI